MKTSFLTIYSFLSLVAAIEIDRPKKKNLRAFLDEQQEEPAPELLPQTLDNTNSEILMMMAFEDQDLRDRMGGSSFQSASSGKGGSSGKGKGKGSSSGSLSSQSGKGKGKGKGKGSSSGSLSSQSGKGKGKGGSSGKGKGKGSSSQSGKG